MDDVAPGTVQTPSHGGASRRGFLGVMGRIGIVAVGATAGLLELQRKAFASTQATWRCCDLQFISPNCPINGSGFYYCTSGTMQTWCCCQGGRTYACGECTGGASCELGPFYCSAGWTTAPNTCLAHCDITAPKADAAELDRWLRGDYVVPTEPIYAKAKG